LAKQPESFRAFLKVRFDVQQTLKSAVTFAGTGLHTGASVRMSVRPAAANMGLWFRRTDKVTGDPMIPASWDAVVPSRLCTILANIDGVQVQTVEHVMAALAGTGIHNAVIEIDGPEVPILDGSAVPFVKGFLRAGLVRQNAPVRAIRVLQPVAVHEGEAFARLEPAEMLEIDFRIDFADAAIGRQERRLNMSNGAFVRELSDSRTFCREADVAAMRANGLALGGTYGNAVVFDGDRVLSPGGLRHQDEPVRHKMLDALGDLALAGGPVLGRYVGVRAGHMLTNRLLRALFATPGAAEPVDCSAPMGQKLPGVGVQRSDVPRVH
jgi:UDP-3-O-[3-hydroxymyristoyl] N-acetylglucosamine deacetylase